MAAPKGNQFWKQRAKHGRDKLFASPELLWEACCEYFEWVAANPLWEAKAFAFQGVVTIEQLPKMRAMTLDGITLFLDVDRSTWNAWRDQEDFSEVIARADRVIREQKFAGAAADLLNPNIIARDLGLTEKTSNEHTGPNGGPVLTRDVSDISDAELAALVMGDK